MRSIKTKLILATSFLIILLLGLTALSLISEKEKELTHDIYLKTRNFAELSVENTVKQYETYLKQGGGFVLFNKEIKALFTKNEDLKSLTLFNYGGDILFDSSTEQAQQYNGATRKTTDKTLLSRIQAKNPSLLVQGTNQIVYLKKDADGIYQFVDANEKTIEGPIEKEKIENIIFPYGDKYAAIYNITYDFLQARIKSTTERIIYITIFGILIGLFVSYLFASGITKPLAKLKESVAVIAKGDFAQRVKIKSKDEVGDLADSVNKMAIELEKSTKALIYKERMAKELELAAQIQKDILPKTLPVIKNLDIAAGLNPATEIGGDCYDFIMKNDNLISYIGDVTGHGVPSGLVVSVANAIIYSYAGQKNLKEILVQSNAVLKEKTQANMFLTILISEWNTAKKEMTYIAAGHEPPLLFKAKEKKVVSLEKGGIALGMVPDISKLIKEQKIELEKGDVILFYTDGIPEAWANEKENYGMARLKRALTEYSTLETAEQIKTAIVKDVKDFIGKYEQKDDITLLVFKRT